jgi:hypothetical protein
MSQHFPHFARQRGRRERFWQQRHAFVQHALMEDGILGVILRREALDSCAFRCRLRFRFVDRRS